MFDYAVIQVGTHQYRVAQDTIFDVERLTPESGSEGKVPIEQVMVLARPGEVRIGRPFLPNARVVCEVLGEFKQPKLISYKFKRRKGYQRKKGHRQRMIRLKVTEIQGE